MAPNEQMQTAELNVVVTMDSGSSGWGCLAPDPSLRVGRIQFHLNPPEPMKADFWIVFANARPLDRIHCAPENTLLIVGEPAEKKIYPRPYYRQFYHVVDTHDGSQHPRLRMHAPCFSWHVGLNHSRHAFDYGYAELSVLARPEKVENKLSVVCSDAAHTEGQRQRLAFLENLKHHLGDRLVHFGRGFRPVEDKMDAILGYRFHLVLENCQAPHYWTEKLADAYLGWAFPFYVGCPNLEDYFPESAFTRVDVTQAEAAAQQIISALDNEVTETEQRAVAGARQQVLTVYNPWMQWAKWAAQLHQPDAVGRWVTLRSHKAFRPFPRNLIYRIRQCMRS